MADVHGLNASGYQRVGPLTLAVAALADFGVEASAILSCCGLPLDALDRPERTIPYTKCGEFLEACVATTGCEHFGLMLAEKKPTIEDFGVIGELMRNAPTLGDGLRDFVANHHRYADGGMLYLWPGVDAISFGYAVYNSGKVKWAPLLADVVISIACQTIRSLSNISPVEVLLARDAPRDAKAYERHYRAPVRFNAEIFGLAFARSALESPIPGADALARQRLQQALNKYWAANAPDILSQTQRAIFPNILVSKPTIDSVSQALSLHPRTLGRRLREHGVSFRGELNRLRYELARQLLSNTAIPITQIAAAFGYANVTVFAQSFRSWSGMNPSQWRAEASRCIM